MRAAKLEPAEMVFNFRLPTNASDPNTRQHIDLSQIASLVNRRFYRQGINWAVAGFTLHTNNIAHPEGGFVNINKLPSTWTFGNAWEKGFRTWEKMNREALDESESLRPKFMDFKIYADKAHHENGFTNNMKCYVKDTTGLVHSVHLGEWEASKVYIPTGTAGTQGQSQQRELIGVGGNYPGVSTVSGLDAVSLIEGYAASRALPDVLDPNAPDDAASVDGFNPQNWLTAIFNEGTEQKEEILEDMVGPLAENNLAPYPFENDGTQTDTQYPGGANQLPGMILHDKISVTTTTIGRRTTGRGGMFPCGLIQLNYSNTLEDAELQVHLVPGTHRGYLCQPMTEM